MLELQGNNIGLQGPQQTHRDSKGRDGPKDGVNPDRWTKCRINEKRNGHKQKAENEDQEYGWAVGRIILAEVEAAFHAFVAQIERDAGLKKIALTALRTFTVPAKAYR